MVRSVNALNPQASGTGRLQDTIRHLITPNRGGLSRCASQPAYSSEKTFDKMRFLR